MANHGTTAADALMTMGAKLLVRTASLFDMLPFSLIERIGV